MYLSSRDIRTRITPYPDTWPFDACFETEHAKLGPVAASSVQSSYLFQNHVIHSPFSNMANAAGPELDSDSETLDLFTDPPDYYPPSPKPTNETHTLLSGRVLSLRLVGHNPLWGHHLWQAGRIISTYLEKSPSLIASKTVLELGAGAGLPSLVCSILGATKVVVTDYPDPDLISNLWQNIDTAKLNGDDDEKKIVAEGYTWGAEPTSLLSHLPSTSKFDILILADLLFNHSEHEKLASTIQQTLSKSPDSKALVFFTPYRPWLYEKDMAFFELVKEKGFVVEKVLEEMMEKVMFDGDPGDEGLRRTVFGYVVRWKL